MEERYNGYANYDTWLVALWLNNDEENYRRMRHMVNGVGTGKDLNMLTDLELFDKLRTYHYGDKIDWHNVDLDEIREVLKEEMWVE